MAELVRQGDARLREAGVASPEYDARALLAHTLGIRAGQLAVVDPVPAEACTTYLALIEQRAERVPLQHLTGIAGFRRLDLAVGPGVFVPRPETEVLVDWGLDRIRGLPAPLVVDLCAGSGAIALSVADEAPQARVHAVERERFAVAWAERNNADGRIEVHEADVDGALPELSGQVDLVLANPPYIPDGASVEPEVAHHDPAAALWGGPDGLAVVRIVVATAARLLRPGGWFGVEHADRQGERVPALLKEMGSWEQVTDHRDLAGRPRFAAAVRAPDVRGRDAGRNGAR
ncbi:MAG TPA: peptide chain release factor N(5)-glutamine methyltransferase [Mycobacteriales bacterium]